MFMGLLELIKLKRVLICDEGEEDELQDGLLMKFRLNPDYVPEEGVNSEFDQTESEGA